MGKLIDRMVGKTEKRTRRYELAAVAAAAAATRTNYRVCGHLFIVTIALLARPSVFDCCGLFPFLLLLMTRSGAWMSSTGTLSAVTTTWRLRHTTQGRRKTTRASSATREFISWLCIVMYQLPKRCSSKFLINQYNSNLPLRCCHTCPVAILSDLIINRLRRIANYTKQTNVHGFGTQHSVTLSQSVVGRNAFRFRDTSVEETVSYSINKCPLWL